MKCRHEIKKDENIWKMPCDKEYWLVICTNERCPAKGDPRNVRICTPSQCKFYEDAGDK